MFTLRALSMGYHVAVLDPDAHSPAGSVADRHIRAAYTDETALDELAASCLAVTTEFENVPAATLERLARRTIVRPPVGAVAIAQDRIAEKTFLRDAGFATATFRAVRNEGELRDAVSAVPLPALLKTSRLGYDGKGQALVTDSASAIEAFERVRSVPCVLEERLTLETELSVVLARGADGQTQAFPVGENRHRDGILETTVVPATVPAALADAARALATGVAERMAYMGVLAVEMFVANGGRLFVNEMAPRPHNSGHYTMDACTVDQFEQQLRALCGLPLGQPSLLSPVAMINLLGDLWDAGEPRWAEALRLPGVRLHLYGKTEPRRGRKMGHLNCVAASPEGALALAYQARAALAVAPVAATRSGERPTAPSKRR
jgi:5-(carboxyamino)imidazole ribonucleotide synthase